MKQTIEIEVPDGKKAVWKDNKIVFEDIKPQLPRTWEEFCKQNNINKNKEKIKDILEQHGVFARLLRYLYYVDGNKTIDFYGYVLNLRKKTIIEKLCLSNTDNFIIKDDIFTLVNILKIYKNNCSKNEIKYIENAQKNYNENDESYNSIWNSVERFWRCCIEQNRVTSIENNPDKIIAVLKSYSDLRDVRNKLNHANFTNVSNERSY